MVDEGNGLSDRSARVKLIHPRLRVPVIAGLVIIITIITAYNHIVLGREQVFTHLYYFPVVMACLWWRRVGLVVPVFLGVMLLGSRLISGINHTMSDDLVRAVMFVAVGVIVAILSERRNREYQSALKEKSHRIKKTLEHAAYVEKVAHELRNPLQVVIGCLDSLEIESLMTEQKHLMDVLDEKVMEMRTRITDLTKKENYEESVGSGGRSGR